MFFDDKILFGVTSYYKRKFGKIGYIGWTGNNNLGDEALLEAFKNQFKNYSSCYPKSIGNKILHKGIGRKNYFKAGFLGGGTMIFTGAFNALEEWNSLGIPLFTYGSGVRDPIYWKTRCKDKKQLIEFCEFQDNWVKLLKKFEIIAVRGKKSSLILDKMGISSQIIGDPALLFTQEKTIQIPKQNTIAVNIGLCEGNVLGGNETDIFTLVRDTLDLLGGKGWSVRILCVHDRDKELCQKLASATKAPILSMHNIYSSPKDYISVVQSCSVALGVKLHAGILAYASGVPMLMIEYRPKCRDFMATCDAEDRCFRIDMVNAQELADNVEVLYSKFDKVSQEQIEISLKFKKKLQKYAENVEEILEGKY